MRILMVCLGNICRSPLAEGIMQHRADRSGLNWVIDSAGTAGYHVGEPPHWLSQKVALHHGIDISKQSGRQFRVTDINDFDKIYVMDQDNYREVKRICRDCWDEKKVSLLLDTIYPGEQKEVPDPWYGTEEDYHLVYDMLDKACERIILGYQGASAKKQH
jgi:protein-tyrosine phosphatase